MRNKKVKKYVETSNWHLFTAAVNAAERVDADESQIIMLTSEPGCGKTAAVDNYGSSANAIYLRGTPDMKNHTYTSKLLADYLNVEGKNAYARNKGIMENLGAYRCPIILDEAQYAAHGRADSLEYIRSITDELGLLLILICHNYEKRMFSTSRLAHINRRIVAKPELKPADFNDTKLVMDALCQVKFDEAVIDRVLKQSQGKYGLIIRAIETIEGVAHFKKVDEVTGSMVEKLRLCEDLGRTL